MNELPIFNVYLRHYPTPMDVTVEKLGESTKLTTMAQKQTAVRLPEEIVAQISAAARVKGVSINTLVIEALEEHIRALRNDKSFQVSVKKLLNEDLAVLASFVNDEGRTRKSLK